MGSGRRRLLRPIVVLAVLLGPAACSAGVPKTGEVVSVSPVTASTPSAEPESPEDVGGPRSGQSESAVAVGFMNAMNTGNLSVVQRWVTPQARDQLRNWDAGTTVRVYSALEPGLEQERGGKRIVPIRVKLVGQLRGGRDWYPASGEDVLDLELENDGADVRVANPGSAIWMRDVSFSRLYAQAEVFLAPDLNDPSPQLAPVPVFVRKGADTDPRAPRLRAKRALRLLLEGPRGRYDKLGTAIPRGTELLGLSVAGDVATINLSRRFTASDGGTGQLRVGQIVWTVNRLLPSAWVRILVEGRPIRTLGSDQFPAGRRWRRRDQPLAAMWPRRTQPGGNYDVLFVRGGEILRVAPRPGQSPRPMGLNAPGPKSAPTWSPDHRSMAFLVGSGAAQVLWVQQPTGEDFKVSLRGRLSPPTWSPDSQKVYVLRRDQGGARLFEVSRGTLDVRPLAMPRLPSGLQPTCIAVSPDGAFVLAVADRPDGRLEDAEPVPGGQLFLGQFGPDGVLSWWRRQLAPGLGRVYSPVWVDPVTVAFVAETNNRDDLGRLWTIKSDGWDPTAVLNDSDAALSDIGDTLTVDPTGRTLVVTARSGSGAALWTINRQEKTAMPLTSSLPNEFDTDPSFASR